MLFQISHLTRYAYSVPVTLHPQLMRFTPMVLPWQRTVWQRLDISPATSWRNEECDRWGNGVIRAAFGSPLSVLEVNARLQVETWPRKHTGFNQTVPLPVHYPEPLQPLWPFRERDDDNLVLRDFIEPLLQQSGREGIGFLMGLNQEINRFQYSGVRVSGEPQSAKHTILMRSGVCRDLAMLFVSAARQVGFASRFVSGYQQDVGVYQTGQLHAWAEVFLPDAGWVGFDPTLNRLVGQHHVAIAAAPTPEAVTPLEGGYHFVGTTLNSTLNTRIEISVN